ncbi:MAG: DUF2807 domain-containing protein [Bacteroidota bacterium]
MKNRLLLLVFPLLLACNQPSAFDCIKTAGSTTTEKRAATGFSCLIIDNNIDVSLTNDSSTEIAIEAGKNLIGQIKFENTGDTLRIYNDNHCNWARSYDNKIKATLSILPLHSIVNRGFGKVASQEKLQIKSLTFYVLGANGDVNLDMQADNFYFYTDCSPTATFTGKTETFGAWSREFGKIHAEQLIAQSCDILNESANEISLYPVKKLTVTITRSGNILYYHEPEVLEQHISGTGKLIRK